MSERKSVSPLLDGFTVGSPVNEHYGVCCYPAVKANTERVLGGPVEYVQEAFLGDVYGVSVFKLYQPG